jgi:hypothetical protein
MARDWDPESIKQALDLEMHPVDGEAQRSHEDVARSRLRESAGLVAEGLLHTAIYGENESNRLKAQMWVLDRLFGRITDQPMGDPNKDDVLRDLVNSVYNTSN